MYTDNYINNSYFNPVLCSGSVYINTESQYSGIELNQTSKRSSTIPRMPIEQETTSRPKHEYDHSTIMSLQSSSNSILNSIPSPRTTPKEKGERGSPVSMIPEKPGLDIFQLLGINIEKHDWPYDTTTLQELIQFRGEQEKTKQESLKNQNINLALQLLKLAQEMNINSEAIPSLFTSETYTLVNSLNQLQQCKTHDRSTKKRTFSDTEIQISKERKNVIQTSSHGSSPTCKKESLTIHKDKPLLLPPITAIPDGKQQQQPTAPSKVQVQEYSPKFIHQPPIYPSHYTPRSDTTGPTNGKLGSPEFRPYVYPTPIPYSTQQYYFIPSNSQPQPQPPPQQYLMNLPLPLQKTPPTNMPHSPDSIKASKEETTTTTATTTTTRKRRNTGINFMISTPTNPPARKYNISKIK